MNQPFDETYVRAKKALEEIASIALENLGNKKFRGNENNRFNRISYLVKTVLEGLKRP